jgi:hypothetical protein
MSDELTPERARELIGRCRVVRLGAHHLSYGQTMNAISDILAAWTRDRERVAVVTAQRDALVPLAEAWLDEEPKECDDHFVPLEAVVKAVAALAAIRSEQTTTTEGGQGQ